MIGSLKWNKSAFLAFVKTSMTTLVLFVSVKQNNVVTVPLGANSVALKRLTWVEVESKEQVSFFKDNDLIIFMFQ